jgi:hypothetical protein
MTNRDRSAWIWYGPEALGFIVEDYEVESLYKAESFDFIHSRLLAGSVFTSPLLLILQFTRY